MFLLELTPDNGGGGGGGGGEFKNTTSQNFNVLFSAKESHFRQLQRTGRYGSKEKVTKSGEEKRR